MHSPEAVPTHFINPDMVLDKNAIDAAGTPLGRVVDVGLFDHSRVKFLVVEDDDKRIPIRTVGIEEIENVSPDTVRLRVQGA